MATEREQAIIKVAESMIREGGYNSFSFRNIATEIGIKSSSVHYHFATKEDLAAAVARSYTERFLDSLGDPRQLLDQGRAPLQAFVSAFRTALIKDKAMCLCGLLGSEAEILPDAVLQETRRFFDRNREWLETAYQLYDVEDNADRAVQTLALLEGAMMLANVMADPDLFDRVAEPITQVWEQ